MELSNKHCASLFVIILATAGCNQNSASRGDSGMDTVSSVDVPAGLGGTGGAPDAAQEVRDAHCEQRATPPVSSLSVEPKILWIQKLDTSSTPTQRVAMNGNRLAVTAGGQVWFFDVAGTLITKYAATEGGTLSPAMSSDGVFYIVGSQSLNAFNTDGKLIWRAMTDSPVIGEGAGVPSPPVACFADSLCLLQSGSVLRFRPSDGKLLSRVSLGGVAAVGDHLIGSLKTHLVGNSSSLGGFVIDGSFSQTGLKLLSPPPTLGRKSFAWSVVAGYGILGATSDAKGAVNFGIYSLKTQHKVAFPPVPAGEVGAFSAIDLAGRFLYFRGSGERPSSTSDRITLLGCDGMEQGTTNLPKPPGSAFWSPTSFTVGADGFSYNLTTSFVGPVELVSLTPAMNVAWRIAIPDAVSASINGGAPQVPISDNGVAFVTVQIWPNQQGLPTPAVVAIQTQSPGVAKTAWPMPAHNNGASGAAAE